MESQRGRQELLPPVTETVPSTSVSACILANAHPSKIIAIGRGLQGQHTAATKERFLPCVDDSVARHDALLQKICWTQTLTCRSGLGSRPHLSEQLFLDGLTLWGTGVISTTRSAALMRKLVMLPDGIFSRVRFLAGAGSPVICSLIVPDVFF